MNYAFVAGDCGLYVSSVFLCDWMLAFAKGGCVRNDCGPDTFSAGVIHLHCILSLVVGLSRKQCN